MCVTNFPKVQLPRKFPWLDNFPWKLLGSCFLGWKTKAAQPTIYQTREITYCLFSIFILAPNPPYKKLFCSTTQKDFNRLCTNFKLNILKSTLRHSYVFFTSPRSQEFFPQEVVVDPCFVLWATIFFFKHEWSWCLHCSLKLKAGSLLLRVIEDEVLLRWKMVNKGVYCEKGFKVFHPLGN